VVIGRVEITPQYYDAFLTSMKIAFTIFAVACFGGVFASLARGKMHGNQGTGVGDQASGGTDQASENRAAPVAGQGALPDAKEAK
jgi:hypothetical protein